LKDGRPRSIIHHKNTLYLIVFDYLFTKDRRPPRNRALGQRQFTRLHAAASPPRRIASFA
jgi:hypothetical protein